jgi:hypothetical protein
MPEKEEITSIGDIKEVESVIEHEVINCIYCGKSLDTKVDAYTPSILKNKLGTTGWHFTCFERDHTEVLIVSHKTKVMLAKHLLNFKIKGSFEPWMGKVLDSCGYTYE